MWVLTSSHQGQRRVERVPDVFREEVEQALLENQALLDAIKEVQAINVELFAMTRQQHFEKVRERREKQRSRAKKVKKRSTKTARDRS